MDKETVKKIKEFSYFLDELGYDKRSDIRYFLGLDPDITIADHAKEQSVSVKESVLEAMREF